MGLLIFLGPADDRAHMLGGTTRTDTTVVDARLESGCDSGQRAVYRLGWLDEAGVGHLSTFRRCGPVRHEVGDHVQMWVSPDRDKAWEEGPRELWLWALVGVPALGMLAAVLTCGGAGSAAPVRAGAGASRASAGALDRRLSSARACWGRDRPPG